AARRGERPGLDGFGIFLARFAQVHVHVNEARRDDQSGSVEHFRSVGEGYFPAWGDFRDALAIQQDVARRIGLGRGIEDAPVLNQKHEQIPWVSVRLLLRARDACLPWRLSSAGREWPCAPPHHWLLVRV